MMIETTENQVPIEQALAELEQAEQAAQVEIEQAEQAAQAEIAEQVPQAAQPDRAKKPTKLMSMFSPKTKDKQAKAESDLKKLRRVDLLELLYEQARENDANAQAVEELTELTDRLKAKLDEKDAQIEHLKERLNEKDAQITQLEESKDLYARAADMVDVDELVKFQELALREYLTTVANRK